MNTQVSPTLHPIPSDMKQLLNSHQSLFVLWKGLTPLAQNEWICWILGAKKNETRERRLKILVENILQGKKRPCCWAGCIHQYTK